MFNEIIKTYCKHNVLKIDQSKWICSRKNFVKAYKGCHSNYVYMNPYIDDYFSLSTDPCNIVHSCSPS